MPTSHYSSPGRLLAALVTLGLAPLPSQAAPLPGFHLFRASYAQSPAAGAGAAAQPDTSSGAGAGTPPFAAPEAAPGAAAPSPSAVPPDRSSTTSEAPPAVPPDNVPEPPSGGASAAPGGGASAAPAGGASPSSSGGASSSSGSGPSPSSSGGASGGASGGDTGEEPAGEGERPIDRLLPELVLLVPEDALDLKVSRLISKVLFEGEVRYAFVTGDITAFLRYRYYGPNHTTQVEVFDQINFGHLGLQTTFDRTRGVLAFEEWPHDYSLRTFALEEIDRISSNQEVFLTTNNLTNTFIRLGGQLGTPGDNRTQAIVGDTRSYIPNIFTAVREIGPDQFSLTGAVSYGLPITDFNYIKLESEAIKRFDLTDSVFLVGRLHQGSFLYDKVVNTLAPPPENLSIPIDEFFTVGGPDNLKGVSSNLIGSQEVHNTWELFFPWFLNEHHPVFDTDWQSWYWILYSGWGSLGDNSRTYTDLSNYIVDSGVGFEAAVKFWHYRFFVSGILARPLRGGDHVEARLSVRSYR